MRSKRTAIVLQFSSISSNLSARVQLLASIFACNLACLLKSTFYAGSILNNKGGEASTVTTEDQWLLRTLFCQEQLSGHVKQNTSGARFSKVPKLYGPFSGVTIPFLSQERRGFKLSNFTIIFLFVSLKTC